MTVTSIWILTKWDRKKINFSSFSASAGKESPEIEGPDMPFLIGGFHSQAWSFTDPFVGVMIEHSMQNKVLFKIELSSGRVVYKKMDLSDFAAYPIPKYGKLTFSSEEIFTDRLRPAAVANKMRKLGNQMLKRSNSKGPSRST